VDIEIIEQLVFEAYVCGKQIWFARLFTTLEIDFREQFAFPCDLKLLGKGY